MSAAGKFDDYIKKELEDYSPEVSPAIWENILAERKKRKPKAAWWRFSNTTIALLLIALLLGGSFTTWIIISHNPAHKNASIIIPNSTSNNTALVATNKIKTTGKVQDLLSQNNLSQFVNKEDKLNTGFSDRTKNILTNNNSIITTDIISTEKNHPSIAHNKSVIFKENGNEINLNKTANIVDDMERTAPTVSNNDNKNIPAQNIEQNRLQLEAQLFSFNTQLSNALSKNNVPNIKLPECPTIEKNTNGNQKYVEIYIGPDYGIRSLTDTANSKYLQKRAASSQFSSAFSAGIRYTKVFENGITIRGGINYSQINEKFSFVQSNVVQTTYTIDPVTGDTTGSYTAHGTLYNTTYNRYRSIDIPLTIGYELGSGRLHTSINAGPIINIYSWQKGDVLDINSQPVDITTGKSVASPYQFKTNMGIGFTATVSMYYKLDDNFSLFAEPYFRYNFQPMSSNSLTLQEKYTTIGLHLGIRMDLH